jgi:hypothetical protein
MTITAEGLADGHRYVMGDINAYCARCTDQRHASGQRVTVLDCDFDTDEDENDE